VSITVRLAGLAVAAAMLPSAGCWTTRSEQLAAPVEARVRVGVASRAWEVREEGGIAGYVIQYDEPATAGGRHFSVRNPLQQELGLVDANGRIWLYVPHEPDARMLGSGTLAVGARRILGAAPGARLAEIPIDGLRGDGGAGRRDG